MHAVIVFGSLGCKNAMVFTEKLWAVSVVVLTLIIGIGFGILFYYCCCRHCGN